MPSSERWREWTPRLAVESIVVVFSILLALVVNEWRQNVEREERRERATEAIRSELLHNHRELRDVHAYHRRLADTLLTLSSAGVETVDPGVRPRGWLLPVDLVSAAWEAARATGATSRVRHELLLNLSRAYEEQARFRRQREDLVAAVLRRAMDPATRSLLDNPGGMRLALNQVSDWEGLLLREYEQALEALGVPADSLEGGG